MAFTAPIVKGRVRPRYRFNLELPDKLGAWLEKECIRQGVAKRTIIVRLLEEERARPVQERRADWKLIRAQAQEERSTLAQAARQSAIISALEERGIEAEVA